MNSPFPFSACWQAAVSLGLGALKVPPGPAEVGLDDLDDPLEVTPAQPASSNAARDAATAPAPWRKRRRSILRRRAASSMVDRIRSFVSRSCGLGGAGTNSPLETGPAGRGRGPNSPS